MRKTHNIFENFKNKVNIMKCFSALCFCAPKPPKPSAELLTKIDDLRTELGTSVKLLATLSNGYKGHYDKKIARDLLDANEVIHSIDAPKLLEKRILKDLKAMENNLTNTIKIIDGLSESAFPSAKPLANLAKLRTELETSVKQLDTQSKRDKGFNKKIDIVLIDKHVKEANELINSVVAPELLEKRKLKDLKTMEGNLTNKIEVIENLYKSTFGGHINVEVISSEVQTLTSTVSTFPTTLTAPTFPTALTFSTTPTFSTATLDHTKESSTLYPAKESSRIETLTSTAPTSPISIPAQEMTAFPTLTRRGSATLPPLDRSPVVSQMPLTAGSRTRSHYYIEEDNGNLIPTTRHLIAINRPSFHHAPT